MKIATAFPETILTNDDLAKEYPNWDPQKAFESTGVWARHIAKDELVSDLAIAAALKLFEENGTDKSKIDFLLLCTQTPDYIEPATSCIIHEKLGLKKNCGALDFSLGCSGFIYGLSLAKGLLMSGTATNVLFIASDISTKYVNRMDKANRVVLGDGAAAVLLDADDARNIGAFSLGTDGSGWDCLCIPAGGAAMPYSEETKIETTDFQGNTRSKENLFMDGTAVYFFAIDTVPHLVNETLEKNALQMDDIDLFVFHQANKTILNNLRETIGIPEDKFYVNLADKGNTSEATIPVALSELEKSGRLRSGMRVLIAGFGVGLSWGCTVLKWQ